MHAGTQAMSFYDCIFFYILFQFFLTLYLFTNIRTPHMTLKCNIFLFCLWSLNIKFWVRFFKLESFCSFCKWKDYPTNNPFDLISVLVLYVYHSGGSPKPCVVFSRMRKKLNPRTVFSFFFPCLYYKPICFSLHSLFLEQVVSISLLRMRYCIFHSE